MNSSSEDEVNPRNDMATLSSLLSFAWYRLHAWCSRGRCIQGREVVLV